MVMPADDADMMHGLRLGPPTAEHWLLPGYTEQEVDVGSGPLAAPGTLAVPTGRQKDAPHAGRL